MALPNSYNVFLETLNRGSAAQKTGPLTTPVPAGAPTFGLSEDTLRPVLTNLAKQPGAMDIGRLAIDTKLKLGPLVAALQQLNQAGLVHYTQDQDLVELSDIGRQVINVGKAM